MDKKYYYDKNSDSVYIHIKDGMEDKFEEIVPGINVEFNDKNEVIGVEILKASRFNERLGKIEA